ncbi:MULTISPECIES: hypothetical protein [unclassified Nocardioides]|uniref:hypothetical protein n=1 Tax=unclassified Nocardioides TaxID=2615069 RepID=UPI002665CFA4|nr:hypothetical protein [Nocardioides sp. Arc9.136]WKN47669.1 hypothetical protein OSR43_16720 [Nocardioides sp. Arc9.136]
MTALGRLACGVAALVLGAGAALVVDHRLDESPDEAFAAGDRVVAAAEGLRDDHVHVTADGRAMLDEAAEEEIADLVAERDLPVYVLVWRDSWFAGYDHYIQAAEQVLHRLDEPGVLVLWQGPEASTTQVSPGWTMDRYAEDWGEAEDEPSYLGDAALRIPEWLEQLPADPLVRQEGDYWGGTGGGIAAGLFFGLPIVLGCWVLLGFVRLLTGRRFRNRPV